MKKAFTLAEVLITLGIIGVVVAMTMPTLIQNQQKRSLEVATQKFYSMMSQAVKQYMADYGVDDLRHTPLAGDNYEDPESSEAISSIRDFMTKYLKVVKECDHDANDCFAPEYKGWDGSKPDYNFTTTSNDGRRRDYVVADGSVIRIGYNANECPIELFVDVNGGKGPNRVGYDLWAMSIFYDGIVDESDIGPECRGNASNEYPEDIYGCKRESATEKRASRFEVCRNGDALGHNYGGCFGHFLENGFKFDY